MSELIIPKEWAECNMSDVISANGVFCDGDWVESKDQDPNGEVRLIQLADMGDGCFKNKSGRFLTKEKAEALNCTFLNKGDLLIARLSDPLGRACLFPLKEPNRYVTVVDVCIVRPNTEKSNSHFLLHLVNSPKIRAEIEKYKSGTTRKRISRKNLAKVLLPIAPLPEQNQIVSIIEQLFSDLDNAIDNLRKAKDQLKVYRQAVLKYAFEGKLTEEWCKQNKLSNTDWRDMSVDDIGEVVTGTTPSKKEPKYYGNEYPFYKPGDLDAGYSTDCSVDNLSEAGIKKARLLPVKSVLVTCIGATIGKTGLIRRTGACNQQINAIIPNKNVVSEYVYYFAISPWFQGQIKKTASATTLPILNKTKFQRLMVKVPSVDEQLQIVKEIERRFSICDQFDNISDEQLQRSEALRQSILKQAFEGKLTEEWRKGHPELISGENSAKALLEKIKAERETLGNTRKRKK